MVSRLLVRAAQNARLQRAVTGGRLPRRLALRFVAGEELSDGLDAGERLAALGRSTTLDYVGERVGDPDGARAAAAVYRRTLAGIVDRDLPAGISVKPTQLGLNADPDLCAELLDGLATRAAAAGAHVTLDMEDSSVTEATVRAVEGLRAAGHEHVGCALQSCLHRTEADIARLSASGASLRLCKGAYAESVHIAHRSKADVDASYRRGASWLLRHGTYPRFATHDHRIVSHVKREAARLGREPGTFEFQMLYGVRPEQQDALVREGYRLCVYVPFGEDWYAYFMRRLAERPANVLFFLRAVRGIATRRDPTAPAGRPSGPPARPVATRPAPRPHSAGLPAGPDPEEG